MRCPGVGGVRWCAAGGIRYPHVAQVVVKVEGNILQVRRARDKAQAALKNAELLKHFRQLEELPEDDPQMFVKLIGPTCAITRPSSPTPERTKDNRPRQRSDQPVVQAVPQEPFQEHARSGWVEDQEHKNGCTREEDRDLPSAIRDPLRDKREEEG